ncbi:hypothetical protein E2562_013844 [Oryza meyeriana var. granulata]|uniref:Uncharacterized protein n=1 Tax=Oryza meyeriana var. granulata TaxID=110450 RepID=A0A6G1F856_9ORYZ|nr:hypothetical protein E2562_013844 [Oryza meyeriana var. granulata]
MTAAQHRLQSASSTNGGSRLLQLTAAPASSIDGGVPDILPDPRAHKQPADREDAMAKDAREAASNSMDRGATASGIPNVEGGSGGSKSVIKVAENNNEKTKKMVRGKVRKRKPRKNTTKGWTPKDTTEEIIQESPGMENGRFTSQLQARTREDDCDSLPQLVGRSGPPGGITNRRMVGGHAPLLLMGAVAGADARRCSGREVGAARHNQGGGGGRRWRAPPLLEEAGAAVGGGGRLPSVARRRRVGRGGSLLPPEEAGGRLLPPLECAASGSPAIGEERLKEINLNQ